MTFLLGGNNAKYFSRKIYTYVYIMYIILCVLSRSHYLFPIRCSRKPVRYWNRDWPTKLQVLLHTFSRCSTALTARRPSFSISTNTEKITSIFKWITRHACWSAQHVYKHVFLQAYIRYGNSESIGICRSFLLRFTFGCNHHHNTLSIPALRCRAVSTRGRT